jgi:hypothetical protein
MRKSIENQGIKKNNIKCNDVGFLIPGTVWVTFQARAHCHYSHKQQNATELAHPQNTTRGRHLLLIVDRK